MTCCGSFRLVLTPTPHLEPACACRVKVVRFPDRRRAPVPEPRETDPVLAAALKAARDAQERETNIRLSQKAIAAEYRTMGLVSPPPPVPSSWVLEDA